MNRRERALLLSFLLFDFFRVFRAFRGSLAFSRNSARASALQCIPHSSGAFLDAPPFSRIDLYPFCAFFGAMSWRTRPIRCRRPMPTPSSRSISAGWTPGMTSIARRFWPNMPTLRRLSSHSSPTNNCCGSGRASRRRRPGTPRPKRRADDSAVDRRSRAAFGTDRLDEVPVADGTVSHRQGTRPRRDGGRVSGSRHRPRSAGRAQDSALLVARQSGPHREISPRSTLRRRARASEHLPRVRRQRTPGRPLHRDGIHRRQAPHQFHQREWRAAAAGGDRDPQAGSRSRRSPRAGHSCTAT